MTRPRWTAHLAGATVLTVCAAAVAVSTWTIAGRTAEAAPAPTVTATPAVQTVEVLPDACVQALVAAADVAGAAGDIAQAGVDAIDLNDQLLLAVADRAGPDPDQHALADAIRAALAVAVDDLASVDLADAIGRCDDATGRTDR